MQSHEGFWSNFAHDLHLLLKATPHRHHQPAAIGELRDQALGNFRRRCRNQYLVERSMRWQANASIAHHNVNVDVAKPRQDFARLQIGRASCRERV